MRTIGMGDIHGRAVWKLPFYNEKWDEFVFDGDYFDSFELSAVEQIHNFKEICQAKRTSKKKVTMNIGNHDLHYFPEIGHTGTSGYQMGAAPNISQVIDENRDCLQMAYASGDILFTHAGVGEAWMEGLVRQGLVDELPSFTAEEVAKFVNRAWDEKWSYKLTGRPYNVFNFTGRDSSGDDMGQTPVWIRPLSLTKDSHELRKTMIQIVGHTGQSQLRLDEVSTVGGRYYFIDTLGKSGEYLIIDNGKFSTGKV